MNRTNNPKPSLRKRNAMALSFVAAALLIVAGCGGSDDESASLTKAQFIAKADTICSAVDREQKAELQTYSKEHPGDQSSAAWQGQAVTAVGLPPIQTEVEELAALGAPMGDEKEVEAIVAGMEDALEEAEDDPSSVLKTSGNPFAEVSQKAAEYGFKVCDEPL